MNIDLIGMGPTGFKKEEALSYLHYEVVRKKDNKKGKSIVDTHGVVVGLLCLNEEIELVVQWAEGIQQYQKFEFLNQLDIENG